MPSFSTPSSTRPRAAAALVLLSLVLTACGGSKSSSTSSTRTQTTTPAATAPTAAPPSPAGPVSGSSGGTHATLKGENHAPVAGKPWHYSVTATDPSGHPLTGTVDTEFVFGGKVVGRESPPTHPLHDGRLNDDVTFPAQSLGIPLTFRVVVHTRGGSVTLDWPVTVRR